MFNSQFRNQSYIPQGHYGKRGVSSIGEGLPSYYGVRGIGDVPSASDTQIQLPFYPGMGAPAIGSFADVTSSIGSFFGNNMNIIVAATALLFFAVLLPKSRR